MPPSPAASMRCSPPVGRSKAVEHHKRGRSLEGGLHLMKGDKDDDLALFNDMHTRERDNFLLPSADDFEDSISMNLRYFSDFKLGISIPARGESSDLLNADGNKNDYDWLLTPPDTPLFPSLDDETPPVNLPLRGRRRSEPIAISRSATMEKSYRRNSRSSASPNRLSPSPRSGTSTFQSRGRPSSAPTTSVSPVLRSSTPSRRPTTPPNKPATTLPRSSTPTFRRMSTGSSTGNPSTSGRRGPSPGKPNRGNSASPKLRAWQSTLPGFSSDPPPNLRTSLSDRPSSHVRGLSPASRSSNGRDASARFGRQSKSPTTSRSASSSHSHERDHFSSQSKGSAVSSCEDDVDSLQSGFSGKHAISSASSDHVPRRKYEAFSNNKGLTYPKKPSATLSNSAPKRYFNSTMRQMDHSKSPQGMFRPLLSSVPTSTFYVGKATNSQRPLISMNSSVTTSSNANSDQGASIAPDLEASDHDQDDQERNEWGKALFPNNAQEEVFVFDKVEGLTEDHSHDNMLHGVNSEVHEIILQTNPTTSDVDTHDDVDGDGCTVLEVDSRDPQKFDDIAEGIPILDIVGVKNAAPCGEVVNSCSISGTARDMDETAPACLELEDKNAFPQKATCPKDAKYQQETPGEQVTEVPLVQPVGEAGHQLPVGYLAGNIEREASPNLVHCKVVGHKRVNSVHSNHDMGDLQLCFEENDGRQCTRVEGPAEGTGISVLLLKGLGSRKWPVVQGRVFTATNISCDDPTYVRDSGSSSRGGITVLGGVSPSPSTDLASTSRQMDTRFHRQFSARRDAENTGNDHNVRPQSSSFSVSGASSNSYEPEVHRKNMWQEKFDDYVHDRESEHLDGTDLSDEKDLGVLKKIHSTMLDTFGVEQNITQHTERHKEVMGASGHELSIRAQSLRLEESSMPITQNLIEYCISIGNGEDLNSVSNISATEKELVNPDSSFLEANVVPDSSELTVDVSDHMHSTPGRMAIVDEDEHESDTGSRTAYALTKSILEASQDSFSSAAEQKKDMDASSIVLEFEPTVKIEGPRGYLSRSLTLEEATDTILFCSSIVHGLAYKAATIAMEKETNSVPLEGSRSQVTILGRSGRDVKVPYSGMVGRRTPKSHKPRSRPMESPDKSPSTKMESVVSSQESFGHNGTHPIHHPSDSVKPPKLESKCNCTVM
ncbi:uncharacterized protein LOC18440101 isoform X2 [Amborella trichopoda]|uniref:uncharacterized protein LOC18440101 isoform X2 n=1 Tax=Amborella trichopoda TaxID=13333 RepID=UPI0005D3DB68|nr:uncharacterized protein LOC18440101 isoform X2 [Amborella trichopoda]|eukprot:XP_011625569.1 uncharacterized protein LOC18440101 isoform X2 [Amborella trichopoda]